MIHRERLDSAALCRYKPFNTLDKETVDLLAKDIQLHTLARGESMFHCGEKDTMEYFLLQGTIKMTTSDGRDTVLEAGSHMTMRALAHLRPRMYTATALNNIEFFAVEMGVLESLQGSSEKTPAGEVSNKPRSGIEGQVLKEELYKAISGGHFDLPSLPEVVLRIRDLIDKENACIEDVSKLVSADPAIAAKIIRVSNSPLYRGVSAHDNCNSAISRLGLTTTKQLVTSFALSGLFSSSSKAFEKTMQDIWHSSVEVAVNSYVLAKHLGIFDPEDALLAGLIHAVGEIAVISYAEKYEDLVTDEAKLARVISTLRSDLGGMILELWNFPDQLITVARESSNWLRESSGEVDLCDLVQVAQLHAVLGTGEASALPKISVIPAFMKLASNNLSPQVTIEIIKESKEQIAELKQVLSQ